MNWRLWGWVFLLLLPHSGYASRYNFMGGYNLTRLAENKENKETLSSGNLAGGGGITAEFDLSGPVSFEMGFLVLNRKWSNPYLSWEAWVGEIPVLIRINLGEFLSIGGGLRFAHGYGKIKQIPREGTAELRTYSDMRIRYFDFGGTGSLRMKLPLGKTVRAFLELRYSQSLHDMSKAVDTASYFVDYQSFIGLQFGGASSKPDFGGAEDLLDL